MRSAYDTSVVVVPAFAPVKIQHAAVAAWMVVLAACSSAMAQIRTEPVQFKPGQSSATVKGVIKGEQIVDYTLQARAGQSMVLKFKPGHPSAYFNLMAPGQDTALHIGSTSGHDFTGELPVTGKYTVRVYLMRSAARRNEQASYVLDVGIASNTKTSAPAKWDASGNVACSSGNTTLDMQCAFRVVRNRARQSAEVWIAHTVDGRVEHRYLRFEKQAFSTDDAARVSWRRERDNWSVSVGDGELYLIPDALLLGG